MTPDQRELALWGGGTWALVLIGLVALYTRSGTLGALKDADDKLYSDYRTLYHPDSPKEGAYVTDCEADLTKVKDLQGEQLGLAEAELVPALPDSYCSTNLIENQSIISTDANILSTDAMSRGVVIPAKGPYPQLDENPAIRMRQMAELYLYRMVIKQCIDAKVMRVTAVAVQPAGVDPTRSYNVYACQFDLDASFESGQHLIESLAGSGKQGISMSQLALAPTSTDPARRQRLRFIATLIAPLPAAPAPAGARTPR
jgi:hypothetical protein